MTHRSSLRTSALALLALALFVVGCSKDTATTDSVSADEAKAADTVKAAEQPAEEAAVEADADTAAEPAKEAKAADEAKAEDSQDGVADATGGAPMVAAADEKVGGGDIVFENAAMGNITFSHKFHVKDKGQACDSCHPSVFQMKKGGDKITMNDMYAGKFCGKCHSAAGAGFDAKPNCMKCHKK